MMAVRMIDSKQLSSLLDELDIRARHGSGNEEENSRVCQRQDPRHRFRVECTVRFLPAGSSTVDELPGRTRNLSRNGLALLVGRVFAPKDPVEVEVKLPDYPIRYLAGQVRFCRYVGRGFHEIGILLKASSPKPVFSHAPAQARGALDWLPFVPRL